MEPARCIIEKVVIYQCRLTLSEPFVISLESNDAAENILILVRTHNGYAGFGECNPSPAILGETTETCYAVGKLLARELIGRNALDINQCNQLMDDAITWNFSIKSAFDTALHDIAAQHAGVPLYQFLGGKNNKKIVIDYTISLGTPEKMAADALKIKKNGYTVIKVKLGEADSDVERVSAIRNAVGTEIPLRVDANQGWTVDQAVGVLKELEGQNIEYCEEPIARQEFMQLSRVRKESPVPLMADESCIDHHDARRLIELQSCDYFNLKTGKSGIEKTLKIIRLAEQSGIRMQYGGMLETRLGFTASAHVALTSDLICWYDFDTPLMMTDDPVVGGIEYGHGGRVTVPDVPGLGARFDETFLKELPYAVVE